MQVTSGIKQNLRPDSAAPWVADDENVQIIRVQLAESPLEEPTYVELIKFEVLENVEKIRVRLVKDGVEETVTSVEVCVLAVRQLSYETLGSIAI